MRIQITKSDAVVVIEGDEAKFAEMVSAHGSANVCDLDAVVEEVAEADDLEFTPEAPVLSQDPAHNDGE